MRLAALFLLLALPAHAEITGLARAIDGDTIEIAGQRIRLVHIDAPEAKQTCTMDGREWPCGAHATLALAGRLGVVSCQPMGRDRYGRTLALCGDINLSMVRDGWAVVYGKPPAAFYQAEADARVARRGIWAGEFVEPYLWRRK